MSPDVLLSWLGVIGFVGAILLALILGGRAERLGAALCLLGGASTLVAQTVGGAQLPYLTILGIDLAMALGFGALAVSFPDKLWPGAAGVGQTMVLVFSATRGLDFPLTEGAYTAALNLSSLGVAVSLGAGALLSRRRTRGEVETTLDPVASPMLG